MLILEIAEIFSFIVFLILGWFWATSQPLSPQERIYGIWYLASLAVTLILGITLALVR